MATNEPVSAVLLSAFVLITIFEFEYVCGFAACEPAPIKNNLLVLLVEPAVFFVSLVLIVPQDGTPEARTNACPSLPFANLAGVPLADQ